MTPLKVTFDSNTYRRATNPARFPNDPYFQHFEAIHHAILGGTILPFFCVTIATLEAIQKDDRPSYLSQNRLRIEFEESPDEDGGKIHVQMRLSPDNSQHPGIPDVLDRWLNDSLALGFKFLSAPRIGQPQPEITLRDGVRETLTHDGMERFGDVLRAIEDRGLGKAQIEAIALRISDRIQPKNSVSHTHWAELLHHAQDIHESREITRAVAEWSDGDAIAAHLAHSCDIFCTEDFGKSAGGNSVLSPQNCEWLKSTYSLVTMSVTELAGSLGMENN